jgi:hypothetical protein
MPIAVDTGRAKRTRPELIALVEAIVDAPATEPETDALEWKSGLDLRASAEDKFEAGRQILGFANRHPDRATRDFEGCSYVVLGAGPRKLTGVAVEDPADLDNWVTPYVGAHGPRWHADYVDVNGMTVMVVTIEAPRWGDPIHTLRKGFGPALEGRIYIRRSGKTIEASSAEVHMLTDRAGRVGSRIKLTVGFDGEAPTFRTYTAEIQSKTNWLSQERVRLYEQLAYAQSRSSSIAKVTLGEMRSIDGYRLEIEHYLARAETRWQALIWEGVMHRGLAALKLCIENGTDENFTAVRVEVELPRAVLGFFDADHLHVLAGSPSPPRPWGSPFIPDLSGIRAHGVPREEDSVSLKDGVFTVTFSAVDIRPRDTHRLPAVHLALPKGNLHGDEIEIGWTATSKSASGVSRGALHLALESEPVPLDIYPDLLTAET